jgi:acetyl-CoA carboxylase biotin carboxyl carrier protein
MRLVEQSAFDEVTLEIDGVKLCLRKGAAMGGGADAGASAHLGGGAGAHPAGASSEAVSSAAHHSASHGNAANTAATHAGFKAAPSTDPNIHDVPSPLLGTFYRSPKPGAPPFVQVGEQVEENTIVAIIEVMKLMNTVRAGVRGTVTEILITDGALAEYGETLLRVRKAG